MCVWSNKMLSRYILVLIVGGVSILATGFIKEGVVQSTEPWKQFPKLYDYDDFDDCRSENPGFLYCVVKAHLVENTSSVLWQRIKEYSSDPRHYRRDILEIGVCLDRCVSLTELTNNDGHNAQLAEKCAADRVQTNYNLNSTTDVLNCISAQYDAHSIDTKQTVFNYTLLSMLVLITLCTVISNRKCIFSDSIIVKAFSLSENLKKLGSLNSRSRQDLLFLDGARVLTMLVILLCHASIPMIRFPLKNPENKEQQFDNFWFPIALSGNTYTVQIFFVIGGIVLAVNFMDHIKSHTQFKLSYLLDRIINRLIRLVPVYAFVIFFQVSWYQRLKDGPIADRYKDHCTENWWTNLLFVNNYINVREPCLQFTWYLGADFQLYVAGTIIMMIIWRFPKLINAVSYFMVAFALLVPAIVIYVYNLDATVMMIIRYIIGEIRELEYYLKVYVTFESNAGNYFLGMITGILYHQLVSNGNKLDSIKNFKSMFLMSAVFFISMNIMTVFLPRDHLEHRSLLLAIYGSLLKMSWGILACFLIFYLSFRPQSIFASFLQHPIMLVASKFSYCAYVVQYTVVYMIYRNITTPIMSSTFTTILFTSSVLFITILMGLLLHVCVEVPFMTLLKALVEPKRTKTISATVEQTADHRNKNGSKLLR
ncbi:O-acyltransferase like protein-like [Ochlerotatus camptorhynchus]|uniref:O-acyltransferase like protein-like n=1 Tax=Ochlerotatus camptorhynchus TaxID=644619 RepID=UPI0031CE6D9A